MRLLLVALVLTITIANLLFVIFRKNDKYIYINFGIAIGLIIAALILLLTK